MPEVTIRRCVMRLVRHGGWSWGPEPRRFVDDAVRALPALLARELARLFPDGAGGEISAPLRIDVRVGLSELRAWAAQAARAGASSEEAPDGVSLPPAPLPPKARFVEAIRASLQSERLADRLEVTPPPAPVSAAPSADVAADTRARAEAVRALLAAWRDAGALEELLRTLPGPAVAAWHRALVSSWGDVSRSPSEAAPLATGQSPSDSFEEASRALDALTLSLPRPWEAIQPEGRMALRLKAVTELTAPGPTCFTQAAARKAIEARLPLTAERGAAGSEPPGPIPSSTRRAADGTEVRVSCALPFLLLGPLHRTGWLDLLDATFEGARLQTALPALAAALAAKVLPEPERGWRRTPESAAAAAAFAGDATPRPDAEIADLARIAGPLTPGLDAAIERSLLDGRSSADPLVLCASRSAWLLVDPAGSFVVAHAADVETAEARARDGKARLFVPEESAETTLLTALDAAGVEFVTPARPVRGERWRPVAGSRSPRLFTNGRTHSFQPPTDESVRNAMDSWEQMERRPLPGRPTDPALDRGLALAAALALGTIAWELWRLREASHPALALARFGDLEGTVRFESDRVRVRLPLGKRFRDLEAAGFLDDVPGVPWLGSRPVVFSGG